MTLEACVACNFSCEKICPVSRALDDFKLSRFLRYYYTIDGAISWPCTGCHGCDNVCPELKSPRQLIYESRTKYLQNNECLLTDYYNEYLEHGRLGISEINIDELEYPTSTIAKNTFISKWNRIIIYPGCLISAKYPEIVKNLYYVLVFLGADPSKILIDDELCCGSFLEQVNNEMYINNGKLVFKSLLQEKEKKTIIVTACGSCTNSLLNLKATLQKMKNERKDKNIPDLSNVTIMHYLTLFAIPEINDLLGKHVKQVSNNEIVYMQFPCQSEVKLGKRRQDKNQNVNLMEKMGFKNVNLVDDFLCCGAAILDTHPDVAIKYGISRYENIHGSNDEHPQKIFIGCGNCHRIYSDFKPSIDVESDQEMEYSPDIEFFLNILVSSLKKQLNDENLKN
ncbi:MAG: heterodisulfide reductase-related iron-sulfur binding cluster [Promethearchaeota archaeon]